MFKYVIYFVGGLKEKWLFGGNGFGIWIDLELLCIKCCTFNYILRVCWILFLLVDILCWGCCFKVWINFSIDLVFYFDGWNCCFGLVVEIIFFMIWFIFVMCVSGFVSSLFVCMCFNKIILFWDNLKFCFVKLLDSFCYEEWLLMLFSNFDSVLVLIFCCSCWLVKLYLMWERFLY